MEVDFKKTHWIDAAKAGTVLGAAVVVLAVFGWLMRLGLTASWALSLLNFIAISVCVYIYAKQRAAKAGDAGFSFGQSMGFIISMSLFAGFISGVGAFLMQNYIATEYYRELIDIAIVNSGVDLDSSLMEQSMSMAQVIMKNPIVMIFGGMFNMLVYGTLIGLIASVFVKRTATPFGGENDEQ